MKFVVVILAALCLGLVMTSCSSGPSATETAACDAILKITLPSGMGGFGESTNVAIAIPNKLVEGLIHSGDPTLTRDGRAMARPGSGLGFVKDFNNAEAQCRMVGA
jgi:hypothetical protein